MARGRCPCCSTPDAGRSRPAALRHARSRGRRRAGTSRRRAAEPRRPRIVPFDHASVAVERVGADLHRAARARDEVAHPVAAVTSAREQVDRVGLGRGREPDLDPVRLAADPSGRRHVTKGLLRQGLVHRRHGRERSPPAGRSQNSSCAIRRRPRASVAPIGVVQREHEQPGRERVRGTPTPRSPCGVDTRPRPRAVRHQASRARLNRRASSSVVQSRSGIARSCAGSDRIPSGSMSLNRPGSFGSSSTFGGMRVAVDKHGRRSVERRRRDVRPCTPAALVIDLLRARAVEVLPARRVRTRAADAACSAPVRNGSASGTGRHTRCSVAAMMSICSSTGRSSAASGRPEPLLEHRPPGSCRSGRTRT